jgi:hypothetical protein
LFELLSLSSEVQRTQKSKKVKAVPASMSGGSLLDIKVIINTNVGQIASLSGYEPFYMICINTNYELKPYQKPKCD